MSAEGILEPGTVLFDYRIVEPIGRGGWAYVYKAQHVALPMLVAIKQLKPELTEYPEALQRFLREAEIIARLNHPNVVRIYNLKQDPDSGLYYMVTEFAEKGTLADLLGKNPAGLPVDQVVRIAAQVCNGLEAVHRRGIVHRDVKPSNVLLFDTGEEWDTAKVGDFGIARPMALSDAALPPDLSVEVPRTSGMIGTFYYMSPEQLDEAGKVDRRSDLYSLGVLLYELLVGQVPFRGKIVDVVWAHAHTAPRPPREVRPEIPPSLEAIVLRALRKAPAERCQSAVEMHRALDALWDSAAAELLEQAKACLEGGQPDLAIRVLRQAEAFAPGDPAVQAALEQAQERARLQALYDRALRCLEGEEWEKAREHLAGVMAGDPDYAGGQAKALLDRATQELNHERNRQELLVRYNTGMGFSRNRQWKLAQECLAWVVDHDPDFQDAAVRLAEVRRCLQAEALYEQALEHERGEEWEQAVRALEGVVALHPPHMDVGERLEAARRRRDQALEKQLLADLYAVGISHLEAGDLARARITLRRVYERQGDYLDVAGRLAAVERRLDVEQRLARASAFEADRAWAQAARLYGEVLDSEPGHSLARRRLARVQRRLGQQERGRPIGIPFLSGRARAIAIDLLGGALGTLLVGGLLVATVGPTGTARRIGLALFLFMIFAPLTHLLQQSIAGKRSRG